MPEPIQPSPTLDHLDFPALYLAADKSSRAAQSRYLRMTGIILGALVVSAAASVLGRFVADASWLAFLTAICTALSFMLTTLRRALKPEKRWYGGRSVAESVSSQTWRYVTGAEPYPVTLDPEVATGAFLTDLRSTVEDDRAALGLGYEYTGHRQITAAMREARMVPLEQRRDRYIAGRIQDQRRWYGAASTRNQKAADRYYILIQACQAIALGSSVLMWSHDSSKWDLTGLFAALTSALLAWSQVRQHEELAQAYAIAALDLGLVEEKAPSIHTEKDLSTFVTEAEAIMSRERGAWSARRS